MSEPAVLFGCLGIMTRFAERLMIRLVPKQSLIALVRRDMINNSRLYQQSMTRAFNTQRIRRKERRAVSLPA